MKKYGFIMMAGLAALAIAEPKVAQLLAGKQVIKRIVIPERLTVCGGPMLSEAMDRLASELERVDH